MNASSKMPLGPPAQAAARGEVVSSQRLPENPVSSFPEGIFQKAGLLVFPSLKCDQVFRGGPLLHPKTDQGAQTSLLSHQACQHDGGWWW